MEVRDAAAVLAGPQHVGDSADHGVADFLANPDLLAERVCIRPQALGKALRDDDDVRVGHEIAAKLAVGILGVVEEASLQQAQAQRLGTAAREHVLGDVRTVIAQPFSRRSGHFRIPAALAERNHVERGNRTDARNLAQCGEVARDVGIRRIRIAALHADHRQAALVDRIAQVDLADALADHEHRVAQHGAGERDFEHDQCSRNLVLAQGGEDGLDLHERFLRRP